MSVCFPLSLVARPAAVPKMRADCHWHVLDGQVRWVNGAVVQRRGAVGNTSHTERFDAVHCKPMEQLVRVLPLSPVSGTLKGCVLLHKLIRSIDM
jgi:hypothetical protein